MRSTTRRHGRSAKRSACRFTQVSFIALCSVAAVCAEPSAGGKRIYISADLEGIAGVVSRDQLNPDHFEYGLAREWMTGEVAAAIRGARAAGATQFVVSDSHGNGQNLLLDRLPEDVQVVRSGPRPLGMMEGIQHGHFDGLFMIGYHAGATSPVGILAHTFSNAVFREVRLNGQLVSEGEWNAALAREYGVPVLLITGDDAAVDESRKGIGAGIEAVAVKTAIGTFSAQSLTPAAAQVAVENAARKALSSARGAKITPAAAPVEIVVMFRDSPMAELAALLPQIERVDARTVRFKAATVAQATGVITVFGSLLSK